MENFQSWSDEQILSAAVRYGEEARKWRNKFLGLLPEVQCRKLYEKHGCSSVVEFAKKVGGVSEEQVSRVLNIYRKFESTPVLQELLVSGEVGASKLARVASVATSENEKILAEQVQLLSQAAVETFVKDLRSVETASVRTHKPQLITETLQVAVQLDPDVARRITELKEKGIDVNQLLTELLDKRDREIQEEKESIAEKCTKTDSRYIPARTRKLLVQEHGNKCSITNCIKPSEQIHHTRRFSIDPSHDPYYLAPLCKEHHAMAHARDVKVQEMRRSK